MTAPYNGTFYLANPDLAVGGWVSKNEKLGELVSAKGFRVETFLMETDVERLTVGHQGRFFSESGYKGSIPVTVESIDQDATHSLSDAILASTHGGAIVVRPHTQSLVPEQALYRVSLLVDAEALEKPVFVRLRGQVVLQGQARSWLGSYIRNGLAIIRRELGF